MSQSTDKGATNRTGAEKGAPDPLAQAYAAYEQLEGKLSTAMDQLVATNGFAEIFTTTATTVMALMRTVNNGVDQAVRTTRLAARQDITGLARQLARTEDKLERLLQAVEQLEDRLAEVSSTTSSSEVKGGAAKSGGAQDDGAPGDDPPAARNGSTARPRRTAATRTAAKGRAT
jgi:BMFP domain-containing protein YqiC